MIHAYALEPELVATWARRSEFRLVFDKFGVGTPRALLELPAFTKWKRAVYKAATLLELGDDDLNFCVKPRNVSYNFMRKTPIVILFVVIFGFANSQNKQIIETSDIENFWKAFDKLKYDIKQK